MAHVFEIRLMFEWGGGCLWGMNQAAKDKFGYAECEKRLPLSEGTIATLQKLSKKHDTALNWREPTEPSPWTPKQFEDFEVCVKLALDAIKKELGPEFRVWYSPLGQPSS